MGKFWEVRTTLDRGWSRVLFIVEDGDMILIHGVVKKAKMIPKEDLDIALKRLALWRKGT